MTNGWHYSAVHPDINYWIVLCQWCGKPHYGKLCPHVKEIEYHSSGVVKRVVFRNGDEQFDNMADFLDTLDTPKDKGE